jgi:hypothetical protein
MHFRHTDLKFSSATNKDLRFSVFHYPVVFVNLDAVAGI